MKSRRLLWTSSALCLLIASCDKPKPAASGESNAADSLAAERAALEEERVALERQRLEEERVALEAEKAALKAEREARLAAREQQVEELDLSLEERQQALADREADLNAREDDLAGREISLGDRELELAGSEALAGWEPEPVDDFQEPVADYDTFYNDLQPYGSWFETPDYGYVYQPAVVVQDHSWRPYTRGRWACTNRGWTWVSDEPFGWACFHYGRWAHLIGRGWVWVPGDEWAPSWVCWREGGDHIGWAPLPPETLCYRGRGWSNSVEADFGIGHIHFTFIHCRHMADPIWRHCLPVARNNDCIRGSANVTNIRFDRNRIVSGGPRYARLRALVGKPWPVYQLETDRHRGIRELNERNARFRGNRLAVFAPNLSARWNAGLKPRRVDGKWDEVKAARAESGIKPEWVERFREARQEQREQAVTWKRDHGGSREPEEELQANREKVAQAQIAHFARQRELIEARRAKQLEKRESPAAKPSPGTLAGRPASPGKATGGEEPARRPSLAERRREMTERMRESRARGERQQDTPRETPADNTRRESPQQPQVTSRREGDDGRLVREGTRQERLEESRRQQQEQMRERQEAARLQQEDARQREEQARQAPGRSHNEAEENHRRERMNQARREQAEQARQLQQERQQEEARERQEQARRQAEDNQRRQQLEEIQRQQQERARQQQEERARQQQEERSRQLEQERARQEERMREQQERARLQAEERARRQEEMQRRQEEARREAEERARQQQEERARQQEERQRQQEEARRQQEDRQREHQERARQEQEERSRRQQEESQRQRRR